MKNFKPQRTSHGRSFDRRDSGSKSMHPAVCDQCGQSCEVPFRPTGDRPIFCSQCFEKKSNYSGGERNDHSNRGNRDFKTSRYNDKEMHSAVCDNCHQACQVPFKPSGGKPVLCSDCFSQNRGGNHETKAGGGLTKEQYENLNSKLDKILSALNSHKSDKAVKPITTDKPAVINKKSVKAKTTAKKAGVKKPVKAKKMTTKKKK